MSIKASRGLTAWVLILCLWGLAGTGPAWSAAGAPVLLEDLTYRVDATIWPDAARARITLKRLGPDRYQAELTGEPRGLLDPLSGRRRDCYRTEMVYKEGRLLPLVYREEVKKHNKQGLKEYRFDYAHGRLELWQFKQGRGLTRRWQTALKGAIYDPLSAFYNYRLGFLGPVKEGDTLKISGIPYPRPDEMEVRLGPENDKGRQAMVGFLNRAVEDQRSEVHILFDRALVPTEAWLRIMPYGRISGRLLPGSQPLKESLGQGLSEAERGVVAAGR